MHLKSDSNNNLSDNISDLSGIGVVLSNNTRVAGLLNTPKPVKCEFCGTECYTEGINLGTGSIIWFHKANACKCPEGQAKFEREEQELAAIKNAEKQVEENRKMQERVKKLISQSGLNEKFLQRTFENFVANTENNKKLREFAYNYAKNLKNMLYKRDSKSFYNGILKGQRPLSGVRGSALEGFGGLFITGDIGTGKTHIAAAIANYLLNHGIAVICMNERKLFSEIRRAYASNSNISENALLELYSTVPLLIIDDMGKEKPSDWTLATLYSIIDARYEHLKSIIITTNYDITGLASRITPVNNYNNGDKYTANAIIDRLTEMCKSITMTGQSWRKNVREIEPQIS